MAALLEFSNVENDKLSALSFSIEAGETRILEVLSHEAKSTVIEMTLGELMPESGAVLLHGKALVMSKPGSIGWIPATGGLISNLKTWENITLPLWYHGNRQTIDTEKSVAHWLSEINFSEQEWEKFMASPVARLVDWERKLAGLLRGLILAPQVLVIDAALFDEVDEKYTKAWIKALEKFAREDGEHCVLVVTNTSTMLPWKIIE